MIINQLLFDKYNMQWYETPLFIQDNSVPVTKRYQKFSYFWWNVCGIYGKCGNGRTTSQEQNYINWKY